MGLSSQGQAAPSPCPPPRFKTQTPLNSQTFIGWQLGVKQKLGDPKSRKVSPDLARVHRSCCPLANESQSLPQSFPPGPKSSPSHLLADLSGRAALGERPPRPLHAAAQPCGSQASLQGRSQAQTSLLPEAPMSTRECTRHGNTGLAPSRKSPALVRSSPRVRLGDPLPPLALHGQGCEFQGSRNSSSLSLLEDANFQEALQDCSSARHHSSHTPVRSSGGAAPF